MTTPAQATSLPTGQPTAQPATLSPALIFIAAWLVPGSGHLLLRLPIRALLLAVSIVAMFAIGLGLQGKVDTPNFGDILELLGFVGQLGSGALYFLARFLGWGAPAVQIALADYGTKFLLAAGLLNLIAAADAHSLAAGRKAR